MTEAAAQRPTSKLSNAINKVKACNIKLEDLPTTENSPDWEEIKILCKLSEIDVTELKKEISNRLHGIVSDDELWDALNEVDLFSSPRIIINCALQGMTSDLLLVRQEQWDIAIYVILELFVVKNHPAIIMTGPSGVGKSWLGILLTILCVKLRIAVIYETASAGILTVLRPDGSCHTYIKEKMLKYIPELSDPTALYIFDCMAQRTNIYHYNMRGARTVVISSFNGRNYEQLYRDGGGFVYLPSTTRNQFFAYGKALGFNEHVIDSASYYFGSGRLRPLVKFAANDENIFPGLASAVSSVSLSSQIVAKHLNPQTTDHSAYHVANSPAILFNGFQRFKKLNDDDDDEDELSDDTSVEFIEQPSTKILKQSDVPAELDPDLSLLTINEETSELLKFILSKSTVANIVSLASDPVIVSKYTELKSLYSKPLVFEFASDYIRQLIIRNNIDDAYEFVYRLHLALDDVEYNRLVGPLKGNLFEQVACQLMIKHGIKFFKIKNTSRLSKAELQAVKSSANSLEEKSKVLNSQAQILDSFVDSILADAASMTQKAKAADSEYSAKKLKDKVSKLILSAKEKNIQRNNLNNEAEMNINLANVKWCVAGHEQVDILPPSRLKNMTVEFVTLPDTFATVVKLENETGEQFADRQSDTMVHYILDNCTKPNVFYMFCRNTPGIDGFFTPNNVMQMTSTVSNKSKGSHPIVLRMALSLCRVFAERELVDVNYITIVSGNANKEVWLKDQSFIVNDQRFVRAINDQEKVVEEDRSSSSSAAVSSYRRTSKKAMCRDGQRCYAKLTPELRYCLKNFNQHTGFINFDENDQNVDNEHKIPGNKRSLKGKVEE